MVGRGAAAPMWATEHKKPVPDDKLLLHPSCNGQGGKGGCRKCVRLKIGVGTLERIDQGHFITLLLAQVLVELQNTCKKKLNRKMIKRPNIWYIF